LNTDSDQTNKLPRRVEYLIRILSLAVSVVELMRRVESYPFRTDGGLVFERSVKRRVYGGQVETAHRGTGYAIAVCAYKCDQTMPQILLRFGWIV